RGRPQTGPRPAPLRHPAPPRGRALTARADLRRYRSALERGRAPLVTGDRRGDPVAATPHNLELHLADPTIGPPECLAQGLVEETLDDVATERPAAGFGPILRRPQTQAHPSGSRACFRWPPGVDFLRPATISSGRESPRSCRVSPMLAPPSA